MLQNFKEKHFCYFCCASNTREKCNAFDWHLHFPFSFSYFSYSFCNCIFSKTRILLKHEKLGAELLLNPLVELVEKLGGSNVVAEITGRRRQIVKGDNGMYLCAPSTEVMLLVCNFSCSFRSVTNLAQNLAFQSRTLTFQRRKIIGWTEVCHRLSAASQEGISLHVDNDF
jgi:hypothetical protein